MMMPCWADPQTVYGDESLAARQLLMLQPPQLIQLTLWVQCVLTVA